MKYDPTKAEIWDKVFYPTKSLRNFAGTPIWAFPNVKGSAER